MAMPTAVGGESSRTRAIFRNGARATVCFCAGCPITRGGPKLRCLVCLRCLGCGNRSALSDRSGTAKQPQVLATMQQLDPIYLDMAQSSADLQLAASEPTTVRRLPVPEALRASTQRVLFARAHRPLLTIWLRPARSRRARSAAMKYTPDVRRHVASVLRHEWA
jgi:hypothetical protein